MANNSSESQYFTAAEVETNYMMNFRFNRLQWMTSVLYNKTVVINISFDRWSSDVYILRSLWELIGCMEWIKSQSPSEEMKGHTTLYNQPNEFHLVFPCRHLNKIIRTWNKIWCADIVVTSCMQRLFVWLFHAASCVYCCIMEHSIFQTVRIDVEFFILLWL